MYCVHWTLHRINIVFHHNPSHFYRMSILKTINKCLLLKTHEHIHKHIILNSKTHWIYLMSFCHILHSEICCLQGKPVLYLNACFPLLVISFPYASHLFSRFLSFQIKSLSRGLGPYQTRIDNPGAPESPREPDLIWGLKYYGC